MLTEKPAQVVVREKKDFTESEILRGVTKQHKKKPKSVWTLLRATHRWVGTILVSLFTTTERSPPATSKT